MSDDEAIKRAAIERLDPSVRRLLPDDFDFHLPKRRAYSPDEAAEIRKMVEKHPYMDGLGLDPDTMLIDTALNKAVSRYLKAETKRLKAEKA